MNTLVTGLPASFKAFSASSAVNPALKSSSISALDSAAAALNLAILSFWAFSSSGVVGLKFSTSLTRSSKDLS